MRAHVNIIDLILCHMLAGMHIYSAPQSCSCRHPVSQLIDFRTSSQALPHSQCRRADHHGMQVQFNGVYYEPPKVSPAGELRENEQYTFKWPRPER